MPRSLTSQPSRRSIAISMKRLESNSCDVARGSPGEASSSPVENTATRMRLITSSRAMPKAAASATCCGRSRWHCRSYSDRKTRYGHPGREHPGFQVDRAAYFASRPCVGTRFRAAGQFVLRPAGKRFTASTVTTSAVSGVQHYSFMRQLRATPACQFCQLKQHAGSRLMGTR